MTTGLSSKVKVVLNLLPAFLLAIASAHAQQNILEKKITINFLNVRFSDALQQIGRQANVHFIYSSNVVEPGRKINYSAKNTSLTEIFTHLGHELNLEFKAQNLYVIIKRGSTIPSPPTLTLTTPAIAAATSEDFVQPEQTRRTRNVEENTSVDLAARIQQQYRLKLDSINLRSTLLQVSGNKRPTRAKFYGAAGLFVNDFSGGIELHAGIRTLYGVLSSGLSEGKYLRMGFGVGTNIHVFNKFSVSPVYTFASLQSISSRGITAISQDGYTISAKHHQLKLMFEYPFAKNFVAKAGPSFNLMTLNFKEQPDPSFTYTTRGQSRSYPGQQNPPGNTFVFMGSTQHSSPASPEPSYQAVKSWVGLEAGIYYSLNFSKGR